MAENIITYEDINNYDDLEKLHRFGMSTQHNISYANEIGMTFTNGAVRIVNDSLLSDIANSNTDYDNESSTIKKMVDSLNSDSDKNLHKSLMILLILNKKLRKFIELGVFDDYIYKEEYLDKAIKLIIKDFNKYQDASNKLVKDYYQLLIKLDSDGYSNVLYKYLHNPNQIRDYIVRCSTVYKNVLSKVDKSIFNWDKFYKDIQEVLRLYDGEGGHDKEILCKEFDIALNDYIGYEDTLKSLLTMLK